MLKIEELSVDNWVLYEGIPAKIVDIRRDGYIGVLQGRNDLISHIDNLKPIPVTDKIFEINGAIKHYYEEYSETYSFPGVCCFLEKIDETDHWDLEQYNGNIEIRYVHELQNLLKLFKNWNQEFKIE